MRGTPISSIERGVGDMMVLGGLVAVGVWEDVGGVVAIFEWWERKRGGGGFRLFELREFEGD